MSTVYSNSISYLNSVSALDAHQLGVIDVVQRATNLTQIIPIVPSSHFMRDEYMTKNNTTTKNTQTRKLNEEVAAKQKNRFAKVVEMSTIYTTETDIDVKLAQHNPAHFDNMIQADAEDMVTDIAYDIINGVTDNTGYGMRGLSDRIPVGSTQYNVDNGGTLVINTSATTMKAFLRLFRAGVDRLKVPPGAQVVAVCNAAIPQAIASGRDELGANVVGYEVANILDQRVYTVDGIPLVTVRKDSADNHFLPKTETGNTTSIWLLVIANNPSEGSTLPSGVCLTSSDGYLDRYTERIKRQFRCSQEIECGLRVPDRSAVRISKLDYTGITLV